VQISQRLVPREGEAVSAPKWTRRLPETLNETFNRCARGDTAAVSELATLHDPLLDLLCARLPFVRVADLEDAVQDAFLKVASGTFAFEARNTEQAAAFLLRMCVNCAMDILRRHKREEPLNYIADRGRDESERTECTLMISAAMALLSEPDRHVVNLFHWAGFTHEEIAVELGISVATSRQRLRRALARMREVLR
jgi:RNA polymerase sigma-70 factor (ECF subfamily)